MASAGDTGQGRASLIRTGCHHTHRPLKIPPLPPMPALTAHTSESCKPFLMGEFPRIKNVPQPQALLWPLCRAAVQQHPGWHCVCAEGSSLGQQEREQDLSQAQRSTEGDPCMHFLLLNGHAWPLPAWCQGLSAGILLQCPKAPVWCGSSHSVITGNSALRSQTQLAPGLSVSSLNLISVVV